MNTDSDDSNRKEGALRRPSRVRRTLSGAAIGALLAMSMVPYVTRGRAGGHGYLSIYEIGGKADVNVAQLVLNVSFAAIAVGIVGVAQIWEASVVQARRAAAARAYSDEQYAARLLQYSRFQSALQQEDVKKAKLYLLHAAENWHIAGNAAEEQRVRTKEKNIIDLSGLPDQSPTPAPAKNVYDQFDTAKAYRLTGPVLEVTDTMIAVQKGTDRWEVARDSNTKVTGDLKVGATVTITYTMDTTKVEVRPSRSINPSDFPDQPQTPPR